MSKKTLKIQTHHFTFISLDKEVLKKESLFFIFFYRIGNFIINLVLAAVKLIKDDAISTAGLTKKRWVILKSPEFSRGLGLFLFMCLFGWGLFRGAGLIAKALNLKNSIFSGAQTGIDHMTQAGQALVEQNSTAAGSQFELAYQSFTSGKQQLEQGNAEMLDILNVLPQTKSARNLLDAAALISQSGQEIVKFYSAASGLSFSAQGLEGSGNTAETLSVMDKSLEKIVSEISTANQKLSTVDPSIIPANKKDEFVKLGETLNAAQTAMSNLKEVLGILYDVVIPKGTVLILFENNNELRPAGGFIGTYGQAVMDGGKITNLNISSIYDLDGQLKTRISPPNPILAVNDQWYLRDSNWFADFKTSARKASDFYEMEGGETPATVIALTPNVITSLLEITGPVQVPSFNTALTADNFVEKTQAISTLSNDLALNQPKQILADFFPLFMQKLKTLTPDQTKQVLVALFNQLQQKQITINSTNPQTQAQLESFNWAGRIFETDRDYLQLVSANLGGTKTDLSLQKKMDLITTINNNGEVLNDLTLTITNQLPKINGTENTSFIRFLVPQGSKLLSTTGFDKKDLDNLKQDYRKDPDVSAWENGLVKDVSSGTLIGTEANKTFFGNWLTVSGGETKVIHITYQAPFKLQGLDRYSLVLQKQIGAANTKFNWTIQFSGKKLQWESFVPDAVEANNLIKQVNLDKDYFFGLVLENR